MSNDIGAGGGVNLKCSFPKSALKKQYHLIGPKLCTKSLDLTIKGLAP